jgi:hypothetical protein
MMKSLYNEKRVEAVARFIADELKRQFAPDNINSHFHRRLCKCQAYKDGLTMSETNLALLRALAMVQIEITHELTKSWIETGELYNEESVRNFELHDPPSDASLDARLRSAGISEDQVNALIRRPPAEPRDSSADPAGR